MDKLEQATKEIYESAHWITNDIDLPEQIRLWEQLRDALGLTPPPKTVEILTEDVDLDTHIVGRGRVIMVDINKYPVKSGQVIMYDTNFFKINAIECRVGDPNVGLIITGISK